MQALAVADAENAARVDFLARMSHELRTPLDTILGAAQLLSHPSARTRLDEDLADIRESGWRLLRMIDDILDHARGLAGRSMFTPEPVDWPSFLQSVARDARRSVAKNGNVFRLRIEDAAFARVTLDPTRLRQVLDNLVRNASRHTLNGEITLTCRCEPPREDRRLRLHFAVADTGEGIAPGDLERIFTPFERGSSSARGDGDGRGLGLSVARQPVERMGGRPTVESEPGRGACFIFDVPTEPAVEVPSDENEDVTASTDAMGSDRTILLVEDDPQGRATTARLLRGYGFEVVEASSGREATDVCEAPACSIDLVLTDQTMIDGDGWSVLAAFAEKRPEIPVILVSAAPPNPPLELPQTVRFAACLIKPVDHAGLLDRIADRLDRRRCPPHDMPRATSPRTNAAPAAVDLQPMRRLVETGQVSAIIDWADALATRRPELLDFASQVKTAAKRLDFATLAELANSENAIGGDG